MSADRNLLFGVIALQMDFINKDQLVRALSHWAVAKERSLGEILVADGAMDEGDLQLLLPMVERHVQIHGDDCQQSLASLGPLDSVRRELEGIDDAEFTRSIRRLGGAPNEQEIDETLTLGVNTTATGRFTVLRPHAKGGLGQVFVAKDNELNREVALKEIQREFADDNVSRMRFKMEAEITGGLEHPGIVPVYGLGKYDDGRPFYAMRFIRGDSLQETADRFHNKHKQPRPDGASDAVLTQRNYLGVEFRQLLGRFIDVCQAVEYAHSRGILHRDLKPGNIMLGKYGETLVVDWGLAKPHDRDEPSAAAGETSLRPSGSGTTPTQTGSAIGTPAFMPPEQAAGDLDSLGPASDVYSLGATLYYVLTGRAPFRKDDVGAILKAVKQGEFPQPRDVASEAPPPLQAICLKAMALEPERRYESPRQLADELECWLADEPVVAYPEPLTKRVGRWVRRRRTLVSSLAAAIVVGAVVLAGAAMRLKWANDELVLANKRISEEIENVKLAETTTSAINDFLTNGLLAQANPELNPYRERTTVVQLLDRAADEIDQDDAILSQPKIESAIRYTLGSTYFALGRFQEAKRQLARAVSLRQKIDGHDSRQSLETLLALAEAYAMSDEPKKAMQLADQMSDGAQKLLDEDDALVIQAKLLQALIFRGMGNYDEAESLAESTLVDAERMFGEGDDLTLECRSSLASILTTRLKDYERALAMHETTLRVLEGKEYEEDSPEMLSAKMKLANMLGAWGQGRRAKTLIKTVVDARSQRYPDDHPYTLHDKIGLAVVHGALGEYNAAAEVLDTVNAHVETALGPDHQVTWMARNQNAMQFSNTAKHVPQVTESMVAAEQLLRRNLETCRRRNWGAVHDAGYTTTWNLATILINRGKAAESRKIVTEAIDELTAQRGECVEALVLSMTLAQLQIADGELAIAEQTLNRCIEFARKELPKAHNARGYAAAMLGNLKMRQGKRAEAEPLLVEFLEFCRSSELVRPKDFQGATNALAAAVDFQKRSVKIARRRLEGGKHYALSLATPGKPATLLLRNPFGFVTSVADLHDGGGAFVHYYAPTLSSNYDLLVTPLGGDAIGADFKLQITPGEMKQVHAVQGEIEEDSPLDGLQKGCRRAEFQFALERDELCRVEVSSAEFDPFIRVETESQRIVASDNNSGEGSAAKIEFAPQEAGVYRVLILPNMPGATGKYELQVAKFTPTGEVKTIEGVVAIEKPATPMADEN